MSPVFLNLTVFLTGMAIMAIELTASRLLAPYFGASLFVWTNLIGVVLLALSLGYFFGGKLADRDHGKLAPKILFPFIFVTGIFITLIPFLGRPIFLFAHAAIASRSVTIFLASLLATFVIFIIPFCMLGMVLPLASRLAFRKLKNAGSQIGNLFAWSTMGSVIGTFLPVMLTIPFFGSRETFFLFGGFLILLGVIGMRKAVFAGVLVLPIILFLLPGSMHANPAVEFEDESVYNFVQVVKGRGGSRALIVNEGQGIQSVYHPRKFLTGHYWDAAVFAPLLYPEGEKFLIIGSAGATSARAVHHFFPKLKLTSVEIDPLIVRVAQKYFGADSLPMQTHVQDGRIFLSQTKEYYDFIMVDVYKDELAIPFHLATQEFFELARLRLTEKGILVMNIAAVYGPRGDSQLLSLLKNTVTAAFPNVYVWKVPDSYNSVLFASREKLDFDALSSQNLTLPLRTLATGIRRNLEAISHNPQGGIATDNRSALEFLTEKMVITEAYGR